MTTESIPNSESLNEAVRQIVKMLGMQNISANYEDDGELPLLISLDGVLDRSEPAGDDDDIELVVNRMKKDFPNFTFKYDREGAISISPKAPVIN